MNISLKKASAADCEAIHKMQAEAFRPLLVKYGDTETNPGAESLERIRRRMSESNTDYYLIELGGEAVGAVRVVRRDEDTCRIAPMFIQPEHQHRGYAQQTLKLVERLYPKAKRWTLDTIQQEDKLCSLYEKAGYRRTGRTESLREGMTIVDYEKRIDLSLDRGRE